MFNMSKLSILVCLSLVLSASGYDISKEVKAYSGETFAGESITVPTDGKCHAMSGSMYVSIHTRQVVKGSSSRTIGITMWGRSIYLVRLRGPRRPCVLCGQIKNARPRKSRHAKLFDNGGSIGESFAVGTFTSAIMCSVIKSEADRKGHKWTSNHPSINHIQQCPGDSCNNAGDCRPPWSLYGLWCDLGSKTCQFDAVFGERCRDDWQCREGFCDDYKNKCVPSRENDRCPRDSDCPRGMDCRPYRGTDHVDRLCMKKDDPYSTPCNRRKDCKYHLDCTLKYKGKWYCEWDPSLPCGEEGTSCVLDSQCCSGSCSHFTWGCSGSSDEMLDSQQPLGL